MTTRLIQDGPARHITTGKEIDCQIVSDMLKAPEIGQAKCKEFIKDRLVTGEVDFFQPIKCVKLKTGLAKQIKKQKCVSILKEDRQAFGSMLSQSIDLEEALPFPLTSVPLSIAMPDGMLQTAQKHLLRNHIIQEADALTQQCPQNARWLIDGMAVMRSIKPKASFSDWFIGLLKFVTPRDDRDPIQIEIINDTYLKESVKSGTREKRGKEEEFTFKVLINKCWKEMTGLHLLTILRIKLI